MLVYSHLVKIFNYHGLYATMLITVMCSFNYTNKNCDMMLQFL